MYFNEYFCTMDRIEREKCTVSLMIGIYCRKKHGCQAMCEQCADLANYAHMRLTRCRYGSSKGSCRKCPTHCYAPARREQIRRVMRYVGPRMLFYHPLAALRHLLKEL